MKESIKINLDLTQRGEIQCICREIAFEQGYRKAVAEFDSSSMDTEKQLFHKIMQLKQRVCKETYNASIEDMAKEVESAVSYSCDYYEIPIAFIPVLLPQIMKEVENLRGVARVYQNPDSLEYNPGTGENFATRAEALALVIPAIEEAIEF